MSLNASSAGAVRFEEQYAMLKVFSKGLSDLEKASKKTMKAIHELNQVLTRVTGALNTMVGGMSDFDVGVRQSAMQAGTCMKRYMESGSYSSFSTSYHQSVNRRAEVLVGHVEAIMRTSKHLKESRQMVERYSKSRRSEEKLGNWSTRCRSFEALYDKEYGEFISSTNTLLPQMVWGIFSSTSDYMQRLSVMLQEAGGIERVRQPAAAAPAPHRGNAVPGTTVLGTPVTGTGAAVAPQPMYALETQYGSNGYPLPAEIPETLPAPPVHGLPPPRYDWSQASVVAHNDTYQPL